MYDESLTENRVSDVIPKNNTYRKKNSFEIPTGRDFYFEAVGFSR